jgi:hypothetical protein
VVLGIELRERYGGPLLYQPTVIHLDKPRSGQKRIEQLGLFHRG